MDFVPPLMKTQASLHFNVARTHVHGVQNERILPGIGECQSVRIVGERKTTPLIESARRQRWQTRGADRCLRLVIEVIRTESWRRAETETTSASSRSLMSRSPSSTSQSTSDSPPV